MEVVVTLEIQINGYLQYTMDINIKCAHKERDLDDLDVEERLSANYNCN